MELQLLPSMSTFHSRLWALLGQEPVFVYVPCDWHSVGLPDWTKGHMPPLSWCYTLRTFPRVHCLISEYLKITKQFLGTYNVLFLVPGYGMQQECDMVQDLWTFTIRLRSPGLLMRIRTEWDKSTYQGLDHVGQIQNIPQVQRIEMSLWAQGQGWTQALQNIILHF